jgi:hypothetical protein
VNATQEYLDNNVPDVETQLMRAGVRLSRIINQICAMRDAKPILLVATRQEAATTKMVVDVVSESQPTGSGTGGKFGKKR